jgi:hypothetical protein
MRRVHFAAERRVGRLATRVLTQTRISPVRWNPPPVPPYEAAVQISPIPLLIVHGDQDPYFPFDHAEQLYAAARDPKELWLIPGFGHAESGAPPALIDRIGRWAATAAAAPVAQELARTVPADAELEGLPPAGDMDGDIAGNTSGEGARLEEAAEAAGAAAAAGSSPAEVIGTDRLDC